jgi:hypothetical protein
MITPEFLEQSPMKRVLHPSYSPDLAPLNFCLFGDVKKLLVGQKFPDREALVATINAASAGLGGNEGYDPPPISGSKLSR